MDMKSKLALLKKEVEKIEKRSSVRQTEACFQLPGDFVQEDTSSGRIFYRERFFPASHRHGSTFIRELKQVPGGVISFLGQDEELERIDISTALFIDTETTGLAGGTGTYPFLTGAGYITGEGFMVRQYFMPDYSFEGAMLEHINRLMKGFSMLVSYNGKSYDLPLLRTRMAMNRIKFDGGNMVHLDLLHSSRRLWKMAHGSCSLSSLETEVMGFYREDDIPGFMIPDMFFRYLRDRRFESLEKVFEHNVYDIVSLACLPVVARCHLETAETGMVCSADYYSLARIHCKRGESEKAVLYLEKALKGKAPADSRRKMILDLADIYKKRKEYEKAVPLWEQLVDESDFCLDGHIELSKYYEHVRKEPAKALQYVEKAFEITSGKRAMGAMNSYYRDSEELGRRRKRLMGKIKGKING